MTNTSTRRAERERAHRRHWMVGTITALAVVGALVVGVLAAQGGSGASSATPTGATNSMGMPIIEPTPGTQTGVAASDGASATPRAWALGRVPLNVAVVPRWTITNTSSESITLGQPHVQVNQGCCPGALTFDAATTLDPSGSVGLSFELSMHPGMDGAHDMTIHVPVHHADGTETTLALSVTGDFRD